MVSQTHSSLSVSKRSFSVMRSFCLAMSSYDLVHVYGQSHQNLTRIPPKAMSHLGRTIYQWHVIATVTADEFLISAYCLMMLYICTKICKNISKVSELLSTICKLKFTKGHNYVKTIGGAMLTFSAYHLMTPYICTMFQENILNGFWFIELTHTEIYKRA